MKLATNASQPVRNSAALPRLELWGGAECTVNRTGDRFIDQSILTGHHHRLDDLDRLASLGIAALRFPLLWERVCPSPGAEPDWSWSDQRLDRLRELGIRPIAGLVHHGSGPAHTSLLAADFAAGLAVHAAAAAARYPWIEDWTPVNEPLTTARFSALYGHWYPHVRDERAFWTALLNQLEGVRLSMAAIRRVNPRARLIQTDDLGRTWSTARMAHQAAFDNTRRWATWDLLCGRVDASHPLWERLVGFGLETALRRLGGEPCPPDIIGINHYLTSDRFLDHRIQAYPRSAVGGNGLEAYADVEAVRVLDPAPDGLAGALTEAWERYRLPLAVTEVHNGCTREEQMRWIVQAWNTCRDLRSRGADIRAVTAWSLFGSQGWNTLLTGEGVYEPGAWDIRSDPPRETRVATVLRSLNPDRPAVLESGLDGEGWWQRDVRLLHAPTRRILGATGRLPDDPRGLSRPPILIVGATGTLGQAFARACTLRNLPFRLVGRETIDLSSVATIAAALDSISPWAVVNAAGWVRVDEAESNPDGCMAANATGALALARACEERGVASVSFSSDLVFGGSGPEWFVEGDIPAPLNVYGRSKWAMEQGVLGLGGRHLVIRTAAFFSPDDLHNFAVHVVARLRAGIPVRATGHVVSPTYVPDLCDSALDLLIDGETGVWHLSNTGAASWAGFAERIADACGLDAALVEHATAADLGWAAVRPDRCALASRRGSPMPSLDRAIERFAGAVSGGLVTQ